MDLRDLKQLYEQAKSSGSSTLDLQDFSDEPSSFGVAGARKLAKLLKRECPFPVLKLGFCDLGDEGVRLVCKAIEGNHTVRKLHFGHNGIGDEGLLDIADLLRHNTAISDLSIEYNAFGYKGLKYLTEALIPRQTGIHYFDLSGNNLGPDSAKEITRALIAGAHICQLFLSDNRVGDEGVIALADGIRQGSARVVKLKLNFNGITPVGIGPLADALRFSGAIYELCLHGNALGDEGARLLTQAFLQSLNTLDVGGNDIGTVGREHIEDLIRYNQSIEVLDIRGNGFTLPAYKGLTVLQSAAERPVTPPHSEQAPNGLSHGDIKGKSKEESSVVSPVTKESVAPKAGPPPSASTPASKPAPPPSQPKSQPAASTTTSATKPAAQGNVAASKNEPSSNKAVSTPAPVTKPVPEATKRQAPPQPEPEPPKSTPVPNGTPNGAVSAAPEASRTQPVFSRAPRSATNVNGIGSAAAGLVEAASNFAAQLQELLRMRAERQNAAATMTLADGEIHPVDRAAFADAPWWNFLINTSGSGLRAAQSLRNAKNLIDSYVAKAEKERDSVTEAMKEFTKYQDRIRKSKKSVPEALVKKREEERDNALSKIMFVLWEDEVDAVERQGNVALLQKWRSDLMAHYKTILAAVNDADASSQTSPEQALEAVEAWRRLNIMGSSSKETDKALAELRALALPDLATASGPELEKLLNKWRKAAQNFDAKVSQEGQSLADAGARKTAPVAAVVAATVSLLGQVDEAIKGAESCESIIRDCRKQANELMSKPPSASGLEVLKKEADAIEEEVSELAIKLRGAQRRKDPRAKTFEAEQKDRLAKKQAGRYSKRIAGERARLYRIASKLFPELLVEGSSFGRTLGLDESAPDVEAQRLGLVVEGVKYSSFMELEAFKPDKSSVKVKDAGNVIWVLKRNRPANAEQTKQLYSHFAQLYRFNEPHLLGVAAMFAEGENIYAQFPFYRGGDLAKWLKNNKPGKRDRAAVVQIMNDLLRGLSFLHAKSLVHGDVTPGNIFLSQTGRAVLGDFVGAREILTGSAMPAGNQYWAPELKDGRATKFTIACDLYAAGKIAKELFDGLTSPWRQDVDKLLNDRPDNRPSADQCLNMSTFAAAGAKLARCGNCFEVFEQTAGLQCEEGHFLCRSCLDQHLKTTQPPGTQELVLPCWDPDCNTANFIEAKLTKVASGEALAEYRRKRQHALTTSATRAKQIVDHIVDDILFPHCSHCTRDYDFTGSFALECPQCGDGRCGFCLEQFGSDGEVFGHVRTCKSRGSVPEGELYAPIEVFEEVQKARRKKQLEEYWSREASSLDPGVKASALKQIKEVVNTEELGVTLA